MGKPLIYAGLALVVLGALLHWYPNLFSWFGGSQAIFESNANPAASASP